jgi:hypothetical protein
MSNSAAAVIDLEAFRRQRQEQAKRPERPVAAAVTSPVVVLPVWVAWVPVWPVA